MRLPGFFPLAATCPVCDSHAKPGAKFCMSCGGSLDAPPVPPESPAPPKCGGCGGEGQSLPVEQAYCPECRWLRPLGPDYHLPVGSFMWKYDADAMKALQSLGPLTAAAHSISRKIGRPWLEAAVNGVRLSERQLPHVFKTAVRAARIIGLSTLPEIYVSGDQGWDAMTLGSEKRSFVVLGSMLTRFRGPELLFVLGREMGHCRADHALWRTIIQLASGNFEKKASVFNEGLLQFLHPSRLVTGAIDAPLMAWSRQSTITADRAGLLVCGKVDAARRFFLASTLRLLPLLNEIDMPVWLEQEQEAEDMTSQLSEWTSAHVPYLSRRLRIIREFSTSDGFRNWREAIESLTGSGPDPSPPTVPRAAAGPMRFACAACGGAIKIDPVLFAGRTSANIRCPLCKGISKITIP
jgi:Zn-dependent protease with chaperone function